MSEPIARLAFTFTPEQHAAIVTIEGEIDLSNVGEIGDQLEEIANRVVSLVLDLTRAEYLDSQALLLLHRLASGHRSGDYELTIVAPAGSVAASLFAITGMQDLVPVITSVDQIQPVRSDPQ